MNAQLHVDHLQWLNAKIAFIFGAVLLINGEFCFQWLCVGGAFVLAMLVALNEVTAVWGLDYESNLRHFVGFEVGAVCAYMAWRGITGVKLIVGAVLGFYFAHSFQNLFLHLGYSNFETNKWLVVLLYSFFAVGAMALIGQKKHGKVLAWVCPFLGGALVSSAVFWMITDMKVRGHAVAGQEPIG